MCVGGETVKPRVHCRRGSLDTDLVRAFGPDNRARHRARAALSGVILTIWAASAAGCSLSFPLPGIKPDATATGSIDRTAAMLSPSLDREDVRRAKAAMAVALDPQGNGTRSGWQNPQSGARGGFAADGSPFTDRDRVCRRFSGEVKPAGGAERHLSGSACREGDGGWTMRAPEDDKA